ncbi:MAG: hypothetical protein J7J15_02110 [Candidatus Aenigmarchaeota archaeon]|nr:hypothetical protein [Candidatus Aenigmarchaeota archaeon]
MVYSFPLITDPNVLLYQVVFPWIFCFAIIYGLLLRSKIFGEANDKTARGVSGIIGLVAGYLIVMGFGSSIGTFLANISASTVMFLTVIMGIVLVITLINPDFLTGKELKKVSPTSIGILVVIIVAAWLILSGIGSGIGWYNLYSFQQDILALIIVIIIIGIMMWFVTSGGSADSSTKNKKNTE